MTYKQRIHDVFLDSIEEILEIDNGNIRHTALKGIAELLETMVEDFQDACDQSLRADYPLIITIKGK